MQQSGPILLFTIVFVDDDDDDDVTSVTDNGRPVTLPMSMYNISAVVVVYQIILLPETIL